ncbi:MAG: hypothetical protein AAB448_04335 [Patescibacteria group bacterium]
MHSKYSKLAPIILAVLATLPAIWILINGSTSTTLQSSVALLISQTLLVSLFSLNGARSLEDGNKKLGWFYLFVAFITVATIISSFFSISARINLMLPSAEQSVDSTNNQENVSVTEWQMYSDSNPDFDIRFEYPKGYEVIAGGTDSFFGYDIYEQGSNVPKIRIIMTYDNDAAQLFENSVEGTIAGTNREELFERYATVGPNPIYEPAGDVHFAGTGGLDSQGISIFIIDEVPNDDLTIADHVFETLNVVNKK